jgi:hypothetical protein
VVGPNGSREHAFAVFWRVAIAAFKDFVQSLPAPAARPGHPGSSEARQEGGGGGSSVTVLLIEYRVEDYPAWKAVFDRDPTGRRSHGVSGHRIYQDSDDPNHLMLSMEVDSVREAKGFVDDLQPAWEMSGAGRAWVLQEAY